MQDFLVVDIFNIIVGILGILSALFAVFVFVDAQRKQAVETQKAAEYQQRLADLLSMANAVAKQGTMITALTDRDSVTKSELKHLLIAQLATVESMQSSLFRTHAVEQKWRFGVPASYRALSASAAAPDSRSHSSEASGGAGVADD